MALPGSYKINFTDPTKRNRNNTQFGYFVINPDTTNGLSHPLSSQLDIKSTQAETSLLYYGRGVSDYGERIAENFVHLLENFASPIAPKNPIHGQTWVKKGADFVVISTNVSLSTEVVTLQGNHVSQLQQIIDNGDTVNVVNARTSSFWTAIPTAVSLVGGNTTISWPPGPLAGVSAIELTPSHLRLTIKTNRSQLLYWDDGEMTLTTPTWKVGNGVVVSPTKPDNGVEGEMWLDLGNTPPMLKVHTGGDFNTSIITQTGGTLTGPLYLPAAVPSQPTQATTKQYVDDLVADIVDADLGPINAALLLHDGRITDNSDDIGILDLAVGALQATQGGMIGDIQDNTNALNGKLNLTGGTLTGNATFIIPAGSSSPGIVFEGQTGSAVDGHKLRILSVDQGTTVEHNFLVDAPTGADTSIIFSQFNVGDLSTTILASLRKGGVSVPVGVYEDAVPTGAFDANKKYQTKNDVNGILGMYGNIVNGLSWDPLSKSLTIDTISTLGSQSTTLLLNHTHTQSELDLDLMYNIGYQSQLAILPSRYFLRAELPLDIAISTLDAMKVNALDGHMFGAVENVEIFDVVSVDVNTNSFVVISTSVASYDVVVGDDIILWSEQTPGTSVYGFGIIGEPISGPTATGLDSGTEYSLSFTIDGGGQDATVELTAMGSNLTTFTDVISEINDAILALSFDSPPTPSAIAYIDSGNLIIQSGLSGVGSFITLTGDNLITATDAYVNAGTSVPVTQTDGLDPAPTIKTSISTIQEDVPSVGQSTITVTNSLAGYTPFDIGAVGVAVVDLDDTNLVTKKAAQQMIDTQVSSFHPTGRMGAQLMISPTGALGAYHLATLRNSHMYHPTTIADFFDLTAADATSSRAEIHSTLTTPASIGARLTASNIALNYASIRMKSHDHPTHDWTSSNNSGWIVMFEGSLDVRFPENEGSAFIGFSDAGDPLTTVGSVGFMIEGDGTVNAIATGGVGGDSIVSVDTVSAAAGWIQSQLPIRIIASESYSPNLQHFDMYLNGLLVASFTEASSTIDFNIPVLTVYNEVVTPTGNIRADFCEWTQQIYVPHTE